MVPSLSNLKGKLAEAKFTTKQGRYNNEAMKHKPTATPKLISALYVEVQFYPWFRFNFLLFLGMLMDDNEFETKENKI